MNSSSNKGRFTLRRMLKPVLTSIGVGVGALATWLVALLTAYSFDHALDMVFKQAIWLVPTSLLFSITILMSFPIKKRSETE